MISNILLPHFKKTFSSIDWPAQFSPGICSLLHISKANLGEGQQSDRCLILPFKLLVIISKQQKSKHNSANKQVSKQASKQ